MKPSSERTTPSICVLRASEPSLTEACTIWLSLSCSLGFELGEETVEDEIDESEGDMRYERCFFEIRWLNGAQHTMRIPRKKPRCEAAPADIPNGVVFGVESQ